MQDSCTQGGSKIYGFRMKVRSLFEESVSFHIPEHACQQRIRQPRQRMVHEAPLHRSLEAFDLPRCPDGGIQHANLPTQPLALGCVSVRLHHRHKRNTRPRPDQVWDFRCCSNNRRVPIPEFLANVSWSVGLLLEMDVKTCLDNLRILRPLHIDVGDSCGPTQSGSREPPYPHICLQVRLDSGI